MSINISSGAVPELIGHRGKRIFGLEREFKVRIKIMPDKKEEKRNICIKGKDEDVKRVIQVIQNIEYNYLHPPSTFKCDGMRQNAEKRHVEQDLRSAAAQMTETMENQVVQQKSASDMNNNNDVELEEEETDENFTYESTMVTWESVNPQIEIARRERWAKVPDFVKDLSHKVGALMSDIDSDNFQPKNYIFVSRLKEIAEDPVNIPKPIAKFENFLNHFSHVLKEIDQQGFEKPTPIQSAMSGILLKGEDCVGVAPTGSGKTLAFLLPAIIHVDNQSRRTFKLGLPSALILTSNPESVGEIEKEMAKYYDGSAVGLYGGDNLEREIETLKAGVEMIVSTPGRLNKFVTDGHIKLEYISFLVLDKIENMLDMGFESEMRKFIAEIREDRQIVMTCVDFTPSVERVALSHMKNPIRVEVKPPPHVAIQTIEIMNQEDKFERIMKFIGEELKPDEKAVIFCDRKDSADHVSCKLTLKGLQHLAIDGKRFDREDALQKFKTGDIKILIATDVPVNDIALEDLTYVLNYDFPRSIDEYVERVKLIERTGSSLSYMTHANWGLAKDLIEILTLAKQIIPEQLIEMAANFEAKMANECKAAFYQEGSYGSKIKDEFELDDISMIDEISFFA